MLRLGRLLIMSFNLVRSIACSSNKSSDDDDDNLPSSSCLYRTFCEFSPRSAEPAATSIPPVRGSCSLISEKSYDARRFLLLWLHRPEARVCICISLLNMLILLEAFLGCMRPCCKKRSFCKLTEFIASSTLSLDFDGVPSAWAASEASFAPSRSSFLIGIKFGCSGSYGLL